MADAAAHGGPARGPRSAGTGERVTFSQVMAVGEFRALWLAQLQSVAGDQLARVAMTVAVYDRTRSPLLTALTYAVTFLPWIIGGVALSGVADRRPRRQVMIACDVARMVLLCGMAAASLAGSAASLWVMVALLFVVTLLDSPFKSARSALLPDILDGERYVAGAAVSQITLQTGLVAGFALGGVVVAALGPRGALLIDAVTFGVSAVLVRLFVRARAAASAAGSARRPAPALATLTGIRLVFGDRTLRMLMLFGWLAAFYLVPMGLAAPYAARFHGLPLAVTTGLVFAAVPFGTALGASVLGRLTSPTRRQRLIGPLAAGSCAVLTLCWAHPSLPESLAVFAVAGVCASYQVAANAAFVAAVPAGHRGQAFGLANGGMQVAQGLWFISAGAIAEALGPSVATAISGGIGAVLAVTLAVSWAARPSGGRRLR